MSQMVPPTGDREAGDPEWLRRMDGWEDTPDWLRKLIRPEERAPEPVPAGEGDEAEGARDIDRGPEEPDLAQEAAETSEREELGLFLEEQEPDWLAELDAERGDGVLLPETEGDDIPDWLRRMSPLAEAEAEAEFEPWESGLGAGESSRPAGGAVQPEEEARPAAAPEDELSFPEEPEIPDWLRDLSAPDRPPKEDEREAPAWLAELDRAAKGAPGAPESALGEPGADLEGELAEAIGAPGKPSAAPADLSGAADDLPGTLEELDEDEARVPDWLLGLAEEAETTQGEGVEEPLLPVEELEGPAQEAGPEDELEALLAEGEALAEEERRADQAAEIPDWLVEMAEQPLPEDVEFLAELEESAGDELPLPTVQEIVGQEPEEVEEGPEEEFAEEWLYVEEEEPLEEPILVFAETELAQADMPEWLDELRVQEEQRSPDDTVETSGPLSGLSGLINPDPLFAIVHKSEYAALSPTPDAQQEQARLLRTFLGAPPPRPALEPAVPGREAAAGLGRWVLYGLLLAAIVVGMFSPALPGLIEPPQTAEGVAFFDAVGLLPQGSEALLVIDYDASHDGELTPQARAILRHLRDRGLGTVLISHTPQGAAIVEDLIREGAAGALAGPYIAGENYVNLGYMPAHAALLQAFIANPMGGAALWGADLADAAQTPLGQRVGRFEDLDLILIVSSSQEHVRWWIEQTAIAGEQAGIVVGASASIAPHLLPFTVGAGGTGIEGMLIGLAGAAEYEQLSGAQFVPSARENLILAGCAQFVLAAIVLASGIRSVFGRSKGA